MNEKFDLDTLAVRAGITRSQFGEHSEALYLTSSYVFNSAAEAAARFSGAQPGNVYSRFTNPTVAMFQDRLAARLHETGQRPELAHGARARVEASIAPEVDFVMSAIVGVAGLMGAGRTELLLHLFGAWGRRESGEVRLRGMSYSAPSPRESIARGLVLATEDRRRHGLVLGRDIGFNLSLPSLARFTRRTGTLDLAAEETENQTMFDSLRIRAPGVGTRGVTGFAAAPAFITFWNSGYSVSAPPSVQAAGSLWRSPNSVSIVFVPGR